MRQPERGRHLLDDPLVRQPLVHVGQRIALYLLLEVVVQLSSGAYPAFLAQILQYRPEQIVQLVVQIPVDEVQRLLNGGLVLPLLDQVGVHLLEELGVELEGVRHHLAAGQLALQQHLDLGEVSDRVHDPQEAVRYVPARQQPLLGLRQGVQCAAPRAHQSHLPVVGADLPHVLVVRPDRVVRRVQERAQREGGVHEGALQRAFDGLLELAARGQVGVDVDPVLHEVEVLADLLLPAYEHDIYVGLPPDRVVGEAAEQDGGDDVPILLDLTYERIQRLVEERYRLRELLVARGSLLLQHISYHIQHRFSQLLPRAEQAFRDGTYRHLKKGGDVFLRVVTDVEEDSDHALVLRQLPYSCQHPRALLLALVDRIGRWLVRRHLRHQVQRDGVQALAARQPVALRQHYPLEPSREGFGLAQLVQVAPCGDERFLGGVLGQMKVAQH